MRELTVDTVAKVSGGIDTIVVTGTARSSGGVGLRFLAFTGFAPPAPMPSEVEELEPEDEEQSLLEEFSEDLTDLLEGNTSRDAEGAWDRENKYARNGEGFDARDAKTQIDDNTVLMRDGSFWFDSDGNGTYDMNYRFVPRQGGDGYEAYWDENANGTIDSRI